MSAIAKNWYDRLQTSKTRIIMKRWDKNSAVVRRLTVGPTGQHNPARDSNPESPDIHC
jgi:hypothetical protein